MRTIRSLVKFQKVRFGLVGVVNTFVDFATLNVLVIGLSLPLIAANIIAASSAIAVSFVLNKKVVFRSTGNRGRQVILFFAVTLGGIWTVQTGAVVWSYGLMNSLPDEIRLNIAKVIGTVCTLVWNYVWYSQVVFPRTNEVRRD